MRTTKYEERETQTVCVRRHTELRDTRTRGVRFAQRHESIKQEDKQVASIHNDRITKYEYIAQCTANTKLIYNNRNLCHLSSTMHNILRLQLVSGPNWC
jgi:hypothetical protein